MAVLVEAISVITRVEIILDKFRGGWQAFAAAVPNSTLCSDNELARVGFMAPEDVKSFIHFLMTRGLSFRETGSALDIAVADQMRGFTTPCDWADFGRVSIGDSFVAAARMKDSAANQLFTPDGWIFENSLSQKYAFVPSGKLEKSMTYLGQRDGLDVYFNHLTQSENFIGRTDIAKK